MFNIDTKRVNLSKLGVFVGYFIGDDNVYSFDSDFLLFIELVPVGRTFGLKFGVYILASRVRKLVSFHIRKNIYLKL